MFFSTATLGTYMLTNKQLTHPPLHRFDRLGLIYSNRLAYRLLRQYCGEPKGNMEVLDVGAGGGAWSDFVRPYASNYCAMDIVARPSVTLVASAENMPLPDNQFELVFSNAVLEHIRDYRAALSEMYRVLKPGGRILLGTHGTWKIHGEPHDYWRWTPHGFREIFHSFSEVEVLQVGGPSMNYHLIRNLYLRTWQEKHPKLRALLTPLIIYNNLLGACDGDATEPRATLATFYYIVAKKPDKPSL